MAKAYGCDLGTMFFQVASAAKDKSVNISTTRNAFVTLDATEDVEEVLRQNEWQYIKDGKQYHIIGEDSLRVANMFPGTVELRRPLQDGVLNKGEEKKMLVVSHLLENAIGKTKDKKAIVCACVSSESVDGSVDSAFHKARLMGILKNLGWQIKIIEEGHAVILSEAPFMTEPDGSKAPYSGIGLSCGAGRTNAVLAYKGLQVIGMSCARGGDYIDKKVAEATGVPLGQITRKKETQLNFDKIDYDDDVIFALDAYYGELIKFVFSKFAVKFAEVKSQFEAPLDIVVAGGTSMPGGFCGKVRKVVEELNLPFEIKKIRHSATPRDAVVKGCLTQALISQRRLEREDPDNIETILSE